jgi:hypothetical protein
MKALDFFKVAIVFVGLLFGAGFGISSMEMAPSYAVTFVDDATKTYITLPCLREWQSRRGDTLALARRSTLGEAVGLGYKSDEKCRGAGGLYEDGRSLSGLLLVKVGILAPVRHWWDAPYRTEDGAVVRPFDRVTK